MAITWKSTVAAETKKTYEGAVLKTEVQNDYRIMSDVWGCADWAMVWDEEKGQPLSILLNVWEWTLPENMNTAVVDATDEVKQKVFNFRLKNQIERLTEAAILAGKKVQKDDIVTVTAGRAAKGVTGKVVAIIERPYRTGYRAHVEQKLAVATSDKKIKVAAKNGKVYENYKDVEWVWARNVTKQNVPEIDTAAIEAAARQTVENL